MDGFTPLSKSLRALYGPGPGDPSANHPPDRPAPLAVTHLELAISHHCVDCALMVATDHPFLVDCKAGESSPGLCGWFWKTDAHTCGSFVSAELFEGGSEGDVLVTRHLFPTDGKKTPMEGV